MLRHAASRGIGSEIAGRMATRSVILPGRGRIDNITEDARKYAAEQAVFEEDGPEEGVGGEG
jgi:hypothetical protein